MRVFIVCWFLLVGIPGEVLAEPDFDGDGLSDLLTVNIEDNGSLAWSSYFSSDIQQQQALANKFGKVGDHLVPAHWLRARVPFLGVLSVKEDGKVIWKIRDENGKVKKLELGTRRHTFLSGADLDGNGITDAIAISRNGRASILLNPLSAKPKQRVLKLPKRAHRRGTATFVPMSAGADWIGYIYRNPRGKGLTLILKSLDGQTLKQRFRSKAKRVPTLIDALQDSAGETALLLAWKKKKYMRVEVRTLEGQVLYKKKFFGLKGHVVGDYLSSPGDEVMLQFSKDYLALNPFTNLTQPRNYEDAIPVDTINVNTFSRPKGGSGNNAGGKNGGDTSTGFAAVCPKTEKLPSENLYKPEADSADSRFGKPVLLLRGASKNGRRNSLAAYASNGTQVCSFAYKAPSQQGVNEDADHYFVGWPGGCQKTGGQIAADASAASGKRDIYIEWKSGRCLGPINPTAREGS